MKVLVLVLAAVSAVALSAQVAQADGRPSRDVDHGDWTPTPSTPGNYGSGDIDNTSRPSRDVDHGSYDDSSSDSGSYSSGSYDSSGGYVGVVCAPADIQSNVAATDKALKTLSTSSQFAGATQFKKAVTEIGAIKNPAARGAAYMKLAGIDSKDQKAVFEFVGAREARGTWIVELQKNAGLSEAQAVSVSQSLQGALRGGLN